MKKIILFLGIVSFTAFNFIACSSDDDNNNPIATNIDPEGLPVSAKSLISNYFSDTTIKYAKQYSTPTIRNSEYSALLTNGFEIDFDRNGNWTEIESEYKQAIPESFLTKEVPNIYEYIKANYPTNHIVSVEKEHYGYSVELNSDLDLIFNQNQEFVGIDLDDDDDDEQEEIILPSSLPQAAKDFVSTHFSDAQYVLAKKEIERNTITFKAYLSTGYKLEFDASGNWTEVESEINAAVPSAIILTPIQTYVSTNYQGYKIISIEKELYGYSVEIIRDRRDIDLKFNANGDFLGIDD